MSLPDGLEARLRDAVDALPAGLRDHILRVEHEADALASRYGIDRDGARIAALSHDLVRHKPDADLLALASTYGLTPDPVEQAAPILLHGPVAARILARDYDLDDANVLAGIDCHTTARAGMSPLEQVLFVADKIEPHKLARRPALQDVLDLAQTDLAGAVLRYLDLTVEEAVHKRWLIHPRSLEARNALLVANQ